MIWEGNYTQLNKSTMTAPLCKFERDAVREILITAIEIFIMELSYAEERNNDY